MNSRKKNYRIRLVNTVLILIMLLNLLISCQSTKTSIDVKYKFPELDIETQSVDDYGNVYGRNKYDEVIFYYDREKDTVTITYDYYMKIIQYGIKTGGIEK